MNLIATPRTPFALTALLAVVAGALHPAVAQTPNDSLYPQQTYLETIDVEGAWAVTTGDSGQKIAIIGTGSALPTHEDLDAKVSIESRGTYDDEDFGPAEPLPYQYQPTPGTATAGIAAAITNNGTGIAGTNWDASILSYDPTTYEGYLNLDGSPANEFYAVLNLGAVDRDIDAAVEADADFILTNFSVFTEDDSPEPEIDWEAGVKFETDLENYTDVGFYFDYASYAESVGRTLFNYLKDKVTTNPDYGNATRAVRDAALAGRTIVAPIGDYTGTNAVGLPARYSSNGLVISVGASDGNDRPYEYSVANDDDLDFVAPGVNLLTTVNDGPSAYREITSTGASAALVTGAASLLQAADPNMKREDLRQILRRTAVDIGDPGKDAETGYGRIDAGAAMDYVQERTFTRGIATGGNATLVEEDVDLTVLEGSPWMYGGSLATGQYHGADLYKVTFTISLPLGADQDVWVRLNRTKGWSVANPNIQDRWGKVQHVNPYDGEAKLITYVYTDKIYDVTGSHIGYANLPVEIEDAQVAYTVATKPGTPPTPPLKANMTRIGQPSVGEPMTFTVSVSGGPQGEPYNYLWERAYIPDAGYEGIIPPGTPFTTVAERTKSYSTGSYSITVAGYPGDLFGYRATVDRGSMSTSALGTLIVIRDAGDGEDCTPLDPCECPPGELCIASTEKNNSTGGQVQSSSSLAQVADSTESDSTKSSPPAGLTAGNQTAMQLPDGRWVVAASDVPADSLRALVRRVESGALGIAAATNGGTDGAASTAVQGRQASRALPAEFALKGSYPNPARQKAQVVFDLPAKTSVEAVLYDALGRQVQRRTKSAMAPGHGRRLTFDVSGLSSGVYLFRLRAGEATSTGKVVVVR